MALLGLLLLTCNSPKLTSCPLCSRTHHGSAYMGKVHEFCIPQNEVLPHCVPYWLCKGKTQSSKHPQDSDVSVLCIQKLLTIENISPIKHDVIPIFYKISLCKCFIAIWSRGMLGGEGNHTVHSPFLVCCVFFLKCYTKCPRYQLCIVCNKGIIQMQVY